jgi:hypothetical protein
MPRISETEYQCPGPCERILERTSENFHKYAAGKDGLQGYCKECRRAISRERNSWANGERTAAERTWAGIIQRCHNPNSTSYSSYGGKGVIVCDRWRYSKQNFLDDMGERPENKTSLGRINDMGNYEPGNCLWMDHQEQLEHAARKRAIVAAEAEKETVNA